ncbi:MAG: YitT family protein [Bacillota bacterium]|jgi:uncharacterized membrane-anchored protein YitT (DUF2179 family)|nr:YitT family protein [Bacillota bacterium]
MKEKFISYLIRISGTILGSILIAISINTFLVPYGLLSGGISGISLLVQYISNINSGIIMFILNIPIFIIGFKFTSRDFIILSLLGMGFMSLFIYLTKNLSSYKMINDLLASAIYGGMLSGLGSGIVLKNRASTGGMDIVSIILNKKYGIKVPTLSFAINIVIVLIGGLIKSPVLSIYTLVSMLVSSILLDKILVGFDNKKMLFIVTNKEKEISEYLIQTLKRGVTYIDGEGAYTGEKKKIIYCVVTSNQLVKVKKMITDIDDHAFLSITDVSEAHGRGFKTLSF